MVAVNAARSAYAHISNRDGAEDGVRASGICWQRSGIDH